MNGPVRRLTQLITIGNASTSTTNAQSDSSSWTGWAFSFCRAQAKKWSRVASVAWRAMALRMRRSTRGTSEGSCGRARRMRRNTGSHVGRTRLEPFGHTFQTQMELLKQNSDSSRLALCVGKIVLPFRCRLRRGIEGLAKKGHVSNQSFHEE